jgi:hypothetical protein
MIITKQFDVEFRKDGLVHDDAQVSRLLEGLGELTDLIVVSHGWNNDMADARGLYDALFKSIEEIADADIVPLGANKRIGAVRAFWPSKRFADEDLIPGGGAASATRENDRSLLHLLDELKRDPIVLGGEDIDETRIPALNRAMELVPKLSSKEAQREYVQCLRTILNPDEKHEDDGSVEFFSTDAETLFENLTVPVSLSLVASGGGATTMQGAVAFPGDLLDGIGAAARRIANYATYYQMKSRAKSVGRSGLGLVLGRVRAAKPNLKLHLVGHSFGGLVVTAAAATLPANSAGITVTLLQAAFSHNGFAVKFDGTHDGDFRTVLGDKRISGPMLITHTKNDKAVGIAYPLASRIARHVASALGDENDPYGGLGRNGAQRTPEAKGSEGLLKAVGEDYNFQRNRVFNLRADNFIKDHGDVTGHQVAYAILRCVGAL